MDQIKKKMLSMKMEKENALDRAEQLEQKLRDTEEQKAKVEEDLTVLQKKHQHLENDFDKVNEQLQEAVVKLETSEKRVTEDSFGELDMSEEHQMESQLDVDGELCKSNDSLRVSQECLQCSELSQESQCSVASISLDTGNTDENATKKKKVKKTKKKKIKTKKKDGENSDIAEKSDKKSSGKKTKVKKSGDKTKTDRNSSSSSTSKHRPEPEGGNSVNLNHMDEYDRVIYGNEPLFSDLELSGGEGDSVYYLPPPRQQSGRNRPGGIFVPGMLGINSSTMIKFAIIETELKNILRVSLKRVGPIDLECKILPYLPPASQYHLI